MINSVVLVTGDFSACPVKQLAQVYSELSGTVGKLVVKTGLQAPEA